METDSNRLTIKNVSYLRARDPSILAFNRPGLAQVRTNLIPELDDETLLKEQKQNDNIRVHLRIKNIFESQDLYEISGNTLICNVPPGSNCMRNFKDGDSLRKLYTFTTIFPPTTTQTEIFNSVVKPKILDFINGQNSTLLTYGASGSGKTFTVIGTDEEPGVVPRSLEYLFRTLPQLSKHPRVKPHPAGNVSMMNESDYKKEQQLRKNLLNSSSSVDRSQHVRTYTAMQQRLSGEPVAHLDDVSDVSLSVWVSFAEIYNEQIYDLLQPEPPRGKQRPKLRLGSSNGHTFIKNLTNISVTSGLEAYQVLQYGIHNLNYASTNLNSHSSRSHSIFTVKLVQMSDLDGGTYISCFNFCDLAGSERMKKTMHVGDRLKESNNINSSLLVLGRCIAAIRDCQRLNDNKLVPFRESKLTQLFQNALAGHEDIAMIVTISPRRSMFDETQHVLNFSAVAKDIAIDTKPVEKPPSKKSRFSRLVEDKKKMADSTQESALEEDVEQLRNAVLFLQNELEQQRSEFEYNEKETRDYIVSGYEKILEEVERNAEQRVKDAEKCVKAQYEIKLDNMRSKYERLLREKEEVIRVDDSSDEEEDGPLREQVEELKKQLAEAQRTVTRLEMENGVKEQQLKKLTEENFELKSTMDEGVGDFIELEIRNKELEEKNSELQSKCLKLEIELDSLKEELIVLLKKQSVMASEHDGQDDQENADDLTKEFAIENLWKETEEPIFLIDKPLETFDGFCN